MKCTLFFICFFLICVLATQGNPKETPEIKYIDIIHCTHTDYGYTDHPVIVEELQQRFLDIAIDAASSTLELPKAERFKWTAEALDPVWEWWKKASPERKKELLQAIENGQIDVAALPYNVHPFLNARQWDLALNWIPEKEWDLFSPKVGIQHDVNGFSRASAMKLLDKGIKYIWNGINTYWGGAPFQQPSGFWWEMPDGRKTLVWQSMPYWFGYNLLTEREWRIKQTNASNTEFRTPRINDILSTDEESLRKANSILNGKIKKMQEEGYDYDFITVSITNQWRIDNDGPFPPLVEFIKEWNKLGLEPKLRLVTATEAMKRIEERIGDKIPTYSGEWTDWWAFGGASSPRDMAASRIAGNYLHAALSPVWGGNSEAVQNKVAELDRELCRYYEHTFAANKATSDPFGYFNQGHLAEKSIYAYRPYEKAKWLVAQRLREKFSNQAEGLYIVNAGNADYTGWVTLDKHSFRNMDYKSVKNKKTGKSHKLFIVDNEAKFFVNEFEANSYQQFSLAEDSLVDEINLSEPKIITDELGWPLSVIWEGMEKPIFQGDIGKFFSLESTVGRRIEPEIWEVKDDIKRSEKVDQSTKTIYAEVNGKATKTETPFSIIFEQEFSHPRLLQATRILEISKVEPRISMEIKFNRLTSSNPEAFYVEFPLPKTEAFPRISNGGVEFEPYHDQIPGTCTDFFTIDGWVNYADENGSWLWSSKEAPLISFSETQLAAKKPSPPENMNKIMAMVYNNMWEVNFLNDCPGEMCFHFDLVWKAEQITPSMADDLINTYNLKPLIMLNPATREDKFTFNRLNQIGDRQ